MSLRLYRTLLQSSKQFKDYNLRSYSLRRCRLGFEQARTETDPAAIETLLQHGREQLKVIQRQATISNMYASEQSVMETLSR
jgi:hypothetical protein